MCAVSCGALNCVGPRTVPLSSHGEANCVPRRPSLLQGRILHVLSAGYSFEQTTPRYWLKANNAFRMLENSASRAGGREVEPGMCPIHAVLAEKYVG